MFCVLFVISFFLLLSENSKRTYCKFTWFIIFARVSIKSLTKVCNFTGNLIETFKIISGICHYGRHFQIFLPELELRET